ncbi:MAG: TIR domain-containing protein [Opitutaceae bacterium]
MTPSPTRAIFLSYAHEDAAAARRIAEGLRAGGIEVWFDQNELRGGDAWDAKIRGQIRTCALFVPIISQQTQRRLEGYFRREWRLAVDRRHDMAESVPFILPVGIDETAQTGATVPEEFFRVQWTRLPGGEITAAFVEHARRLLGVEGPALPPPRPAPAPSPAPAPATHTPPAAGVPTPAAKPRASFGPILAACGATALVLALFILLRSGGGNDRVPAPAAAAVPVAAHAPAVAAKPAEKPAPPAKSVAVLPFANLSEEKTNDFFADGVHDEVITHLAKIRDLKVISRTSVLAYREPGSRNLRRIAEELGVANVLEGSVRRAGGKVRVSAQLINALTDEHLWAEKYDGDLADVFALQSRLAQEIATALRATLTTSERALIDRRPTRSPEAYELYLRGRVLQGSLTIRSTIARWNQAVEMYERAAALDPGFTLAHAAAVQVHGMMYMAANYDPTPERRARAAAALRLAETSAPEAPETHMARGYFAYSVEGERERAQREFETARTSLPNEAALLAALGYVQRRLGLWRESRLTLERATELNPNDLFDQSQLTRYLMALRRYDEALARSERLITLAPQDAFVRETHLRARLARDGDLAAFVRDLAAAPKSDNDPHGLMAAYTLAQWKGDQAAAERALADPRFGEIYMQSTVNVSPTTVFRAQVAWLDGRKADSVRHAEAALKTMSTWKSNPRQQYFDLMTRARAEAFAGRTEDALRDARDALAGLERNDLYMLGEYHVIFARICVVLGRTEEAFAALRAAIPLALSLSTPIEWRYDQILSRLKSDPRFEEIIRSCRPL